MFVKICGITSEEDALLAVAMGADALGFTFAPSPRQMAPGRVRDITSRLPPEILTVGLFVNELPTRVVDTVNVAGLKAAQLHGNETPDHTQWVKARLGVVIRAFRAGDPNLDRADQYGADAVLIDSPSPGTGQMFDWTLAEGLPFSGRLIVAGGLTPDNVAAAIDQVKPWGVDVASGVESSPGRKDPRKVRDFVRNAKGAAPIRYHGDEDRLPYNWQEDAL